MFRAQKRAQGNDGVDRTPLGASRHNELANSPGDSDPTSGNRLSSRDSLASHHGSPASVIADQPRPHLVMNSAMARPVVRSPERLRPHRVLLEVDFIDVLEGLNEAARLKNQSVSDAILITPTGIILAGFGRWRLAMFEGRSEVHCIEYAISEEESLQFILVHHRPRRGWNAFVRIRLALRLEPYFQQRAIENMRAGGRYKGSANLPKARRIDVRRHIAEAAGVGTRNVSKVKTILQTAHPRLIAALMNGTLSINAAMQFCTLPMCEQLEYFIRRSEDREINKLIRRSVPRSKAETTSADVASLLGALQQHESRHPGSVVVQVSRLPRTVILVGQDVLRVPFS